MLKPLLDLVVHATSSSSGRMTTLCKNGFKTVRIGHETPRLTPSNYGTSSWRVTTECGITTGSRDVPLASAPVSNRVSCTSAGPQHDTNEEGHEHGNEGVTVISEVTVSSATIEEPV